MMRSLHDPAERQLVARIAREDRVALGLLHAAYYPRLVRLFAHLTTRLEADAVESLIEETMFDVWQTPQSCDEADSVYAWVMGLALNQARQAAMLDTSSSHCVTRPVDSGRDGGRSAEPDGFVYALFTPLSLEERAVVHFVYTGHGCRDIAGIMSVSCEQVTNLLTRARTAMRVLATA